MKIARRFIVVLVLLVIIAAGYWYLFERTTVGSTPESIEFIQKHINSKGKIVDPFVKIGVESVEDVKLFVAEKEIKIEFGKIHLNWKPKNFITQENRMMLKRIGITMDNDPETGMLRVYYKGEELERWRR